MDRGGGGGGDVNDPPPWVNLLQLNSLVVRGLIELKMWKTSFNLLKDKHIQYCNGQFEQSDFQNYNFLLYKK